MGFVRAVAWLFAARARRRATAPAWMMPLAAAIALATAASGAEAAGAFADKAKAKADAGAEESDEELDPEAAYAYDFDRMVLVDGTAFWGKVQSPPGPDGWTVLLEDPRTEDPEERAHQANSRVLTMPVARVRGIAWNLRHRLERLPEERDAGTIDEKNYRQAQLAIAEFAEKHRSLRPEYHDIARRLYNQMLDSEHAPDNVHLRLARLYDEQDPATDEIRRRALEQYIAHLERFPGDAECRVAVERLSAMLAPPAEADVAAEGPNAAEAPAVAARPEGLEKQSGWAWMLDGVNPDAGMRQYLRPAAVVNAADGDNQMLRLPYLPVAGKDKLIYQLPSVQPGGADRRDNPVLSFNAYLKPDQPGIGIAVAVSTGNYAWYESPAVTLPAVTRWEAKTLRFNLNDANWKSEASNWRHNTAVKNINQMRTLYILIYRPRDRGEVLLDDISFGPDTPAP